MGFLVRVSRLLTDMSKLKHQYPTKPKHNPINAVATPHVAPAEPMDDIGLVRSIFFKVQNIFIALVPTPSEWDMPWWMRLLVWLAGLLSVAFLAGPFFAEVAPEGTGTDPGEGMRVVSGRM